MIEVPTYEVLAEDDGKAKLTWLLFFQLLASGDPGTAWQPVVTNLTSVGTPAITGAYYENQGFTDFWVNIIPTTSISGTAGSIYIDLPFTVSVDAPCFGVAGLTSGIGAVDSVSKRIYPPTFSALTIPLTITGRVLSQ